MPEGDVVWRTAHRLDQTLSGRVLTVSDFRVPQLATSDLTGETVRETVSRGKHILTRVAELTLHTHLKMEGSWHVYRPGSRWRAPAHTARVVLGTADWSAVGFSLGIVELVRTDDEESVVGHLGPDLLGADWSVEEAVRRLSGHPDTPIGEALLDQRNLAGLGTVYRSEACFLAGVHPDLRVDEVPDLARLVERAQRLLAANRDRVGPTTTGDSRRGQQTWVYGRGGQPCRRCGTTIRSGMRGPAGKERVSHWCPHCQPLPTSRATQ
jgi:endonuclease-8